MQSKRGIELSLNFIVTLIISIIIFGFGVRFIYNLYDKATDLQSLTLSELDEKIGSLICEGSDRVCIGEDRKTIPRKKFAVFGLKLINVLDDQKEFLVEIKPPSSNLLGYKKDKTEITNIENPLVVIPQSRPVTIEKNEERNLGIGIQVPASAVPGTYIFNVNITIPSDAVTYAQIQKLYVDVP